MPCAAHVICVAIGQCLQSALAFQCCWLGEQADGPKGMRLAAARCHGVENEEEEEKEKEKVGSIPLLRRRFHTLTACFAHHPHMHRGETAAHPLTIQSITTSSLLVPCWLHLISCTCCNTQHGQFAPLGNVVQAHAPAESC